MERRTSKERSEQMARDAVEGLEEYVDNGKLPECYPTVIDMLYDFYPDLPWDQTGGLHVARYLVSNPYCQEIADSFQKVFNFDMKKEWLDGLRELEASQKN